MVGGTLFHDFATAMTTVQGGGAQTLENAWLGTLEETWKFLENLEIPVDKKRKAYNIVPVWWGKLCGKATVFILMYSV